MKQVLSILMIVMVLISMLSMTALATEAVVSPEKGNTEVEVLPSSPQTGGPHIAVFAVAALVLLLVAVVVTKKLLARA